MPYVMLLLNYNVLWFTETYSVLPEKVSKALNAAFLDWLRIIVQKKKDTI
jgi:hypothetical protein